MPDNKRFEIQIVTTANMQGAQVAEAGLRQVGKATEQAAEQTRVFNTHGRETRELFRKLNEVVPELGRALEAVFDPEAAGAIALLATVEVLVSLFERLKRDAEEFERALSATPDLSGIKNAVNSIAEAMDNANEKADEFARHLDEISAVEATIAENSDKVVKNLEHQAQVEGQIAAAKKAQVAAQLELMKQKGEITPAQYDIAKINLESNSSRDAARREVAYLEKEKSQMEKARDEAAQKVEESKRLAGPAQKRVEEADLQVKTAEQRRTHAKAELEETTKVIAGNGKEPGLQQQVDEFRNNMYPETQGMDDAALRRYLENLKNAGGNVTINERDIRNEIEKYFELSGHLSDVRSQQSGFAAKYRESDDAIFRAKANKTAAETSLSDIHKSGTENAASVKSLNQQIDQVTGKLNDHKDDETVFAAQDRARRAEALPGLEKDLGVTTNQGAAAFVQNYLGSINNINAGKGTAGDEQMRQSFVALSQATKESDQQLYRLIQELVRDKGNLSQAIKRLQEQVNSSANLNHR